MVDDYPKGLEHEIAAMRALMAPKAGVQERVWQRLQETGAATGEPVEVGALRGAEVIPIRNRGGRVVKVAALTLALAAGVVAYVVSPAQVPPLGPPKLGVPAVTSLPSLDAGTDASLLLPTKPLP
jgi:hypothetical protein